MQKYLKDGSLKGHIMRNADFCANGNKCSCLPTILFCFKAVSILTSAQFNHTLNMQKRVTEESSYMSKVLVFGLCIGKTSC